MKTKAIAFIILTFIFSLSLSSHSAYSLKTSQQPVPLGTLAKVSIFSDDTMCNSGDSLISGDVYVNSDDSSLLGLTLPLGITVNGIVKVTDAITAKAKVDLNSALANASSRTAMKLDANLSGKVLVPGVYAGTSLTLNGKLTLDAKGDPNAVFILKTNGNLNVAANSLVTLTNKANSDRVFWVIGGKANIGANVVLMGKVLSIGDINVVNAKIHGALFSKDGNVCLDTSVVSTPAVVGATLNLGTPEVPQVIAPQADPEITTTTQATTETTSPLVGGISEEGTLEDDSDTSSAISGLLAYTGRNALWLSAIALMLIGAGSGIYYQVKHRKV